MNPWNVGRKSVPYVEEVKQAPQNVTEQEIKSSRNFDINTEPGFELNQVPSLIEIWNLTLELL